MKTRRDPLPWALGLGACLFYLSSQSTLHNFDGIACAIAVELSDFRHLAHGNHLAYGVLGWLFDRLWRVLGYAGPAIIPLRTLNSLLGGAGVGVFCALLLQLGRPRPQAALAACGLAISQAYWVWSLEAQVYMLGAFFILLAAKEGLKEGPNPLWLGAYHALAILGHVGHAMFAPAAIYLVWRSAGRLRETARYAATAALVAASAYAAAAALVIRPHSLEDWRVWLLGSAALNLDKSFVWYGGYSWDNLGHWALMTMRIFCDPASQKGAAQAVGYLMSTIAVGAAAYALAGSRTPPRLKACALWIVSYAILFVSWQPYTVVYRITDLIPLWLLIAAALEKAPRAVATAALSAWVLAAGLYNWTTGISTIIDPAANRPYQEALWLKQATPPDAWIVATGQGQVYIPYFAHRKPLNMRYFENDLAGLKRRLDAAAAGREEVFVTSDTLNAGGWTKFFEDYGLARVFLNKDMVLYRLRSKGTVRRTETRKAGYRKS